MEPINNTNIQDIQTQNNLNILRKNNCVVKSDEMQLREAAQGFEAIFVTKLLNQMNSSSLNQGGLLVNQILKKHLKVCYSKKLVKKLQNHLLLE